MDQDYLFYTLPVKQQKLSKNFIHYLGKVCVMDNNIHIITNISQVFIHCRGITKNTEVIQTVILNFSFIDS